MNIKHLLLFLCITTAIASCISNSSKQTNQEKEGQAWLAQARTALALGEYNRGRALIDSLRERSPLALNAREEGILLLDSIELMQAQQELINLQQHKPANNLNAIQRDSIETELDRAQTKVRFFLKKIDHDKQHKQKH